MKDIIKGLFAVLIGVAILVGGYYIGIVVAVIGGAAMMALIAIGIVIFVIYAVYDLFTPNKHTPDD